MTLLVALAFIGFVGLGIPKSAFGVAWPTVAGELDRSIAELGVLVAVFMVGYSLASILNGELTRRFGTGRSLVLSSGIATVALAGYAAAGSWFLLNLAALALGMSGGVMDAGINAFVSLHRGARTMGLLHAMFGIGATLGPLVMTWLLAAHLSWRWAYAALGVFQAALTAALWATRDRWDTGTAAGSGERVRPSQPGLLRGLVVFFLYAGIEIGAGQWAFSLLVEGRGLGEVAAGYAVTGYWAALTAGRFLLGAAGDALPPHRILAWTLAVTTAGLGLLAWNPTMWAGAGGLVVAGLGLAPVFPLAMLVTPTRLGAEFAPWAVGYQLGAATAGGAAIPGIIGLAVAAAGLEAVGITLFVVVLLLVAAARWARFVAAPAPVG